MRACSVSVRSILAVVEVHPGVPFGASMAPSMASCVQFVAFVRCLLATVVTPVPVPLCSSLRVACRCVPSQLSLKCIHGDHGVTCVSSRRRRRLLAWRGVHEPTAAFSQAVFSFVASSPKLTPVMIRSLLCAAFQSFPKSKSHCHHDDVVLRLVRRFVLHRRGRLS